MNCRNILILVLIIMISACGGSSNKTEKIANSAPTLQLTNSIEAQSFDLVNLVVQVSDKENNLATILWAQTSGPTVEIKNSNTASASFTAPIVDLSGEKLGFSITVTDSLGAITSKSVVVIVTAPPPPISIAGEDLVLFIEEDTNITLDCYKSSSYNNNLTYEWHQISGPSVSLPNNFQCRQAIILPKLVGNYTFSLRVTDDINRSHTDQVEFVTKAYSGKLVDLESKVRWEHENGNYNPELDLRFSVKEGNILYIADAHSKLHILNVEQPESPVELATFELKNQIKSIFVKDNFVYLAIWNLGLAILDISDLTSPKLLSETILFPDADIISITVDRDYVYVAGGVGGVIIIDIKDKNNPIPVKFIANNTQNLGCRSYCILDSFKIYIENNVLHSVGRKYIKLDISNLDEPKYISSVPLTPWHHYSDHHIAKKGQYIFMGELIINSESGYKIGPTLQLPKNMNIETQHVSGDLLYVTTSNKQIITLDISEVDRGVHPIVNMISLAAESVSVDKEHMYLIRGIDGLNIISSIPNDFQQSMLSHSSPPYPPGSGFKPLNSDKLGQYIYTAYNRETFITDLTSPTDPTVYIFEHESRGNGIQVDEQNLYYLGGREVFINDLGDPINPGKLSPVTLTINGRRTVTDYIVKNNLVYAYEYSPHWDVDLGLTIINIKDPLNPINYPTFKNLDGTIHDILVSEEYLYLIDDSSQLKIFKIVSPGTLERVNTIALGFYQFEPWRHYNYRRQILGEINNKLYIAVGDKIELINIETPQQAIKLDLTINNRGRVKDNGWIKDGNLYSYDKESSWLYIQNDTQTMKALFVGHELYISEEVNDNLFVSSYFDNNVFDNKNIINNINSYHETERSSILTYEFGWQQNKPIKVNCEVTEGNCSITRVNEKSVIIEWQTPNRTGDFEIAIFAGNMRKYDIYRDKVNVK